MGPEPLQAVLAGDASALAPPGRASVTPAAAPSGLDRAAAAAASVYQGGVRDLMNVLDLSQDFSVHTPAFASYDGPSVKWVKRLAFDKAGGQEITSTLHVGTHLDAPRTSSPAASSSATCRSSGSSGRRAWSTSSGWGSATTSSTGPSTSSAGSATPGSRSSAATSSIIHTGYHRYYPENWADLSAVDETKYFIRHPGPTRAFAEWVLERGIRWLAVDAGSADHPMNTVIRRMRAGRGRGRRGEARPLARRGLPEGATTRSCTRCCSRTT